MEFQDFRAFPRAPALFQGPRPCSKGPGLEFSGISVYFQGPRPWIFKDFCCFPFGFPRISIYLHGLALDFQGFQLFSKVPAVDFQGFLIVFKGPALDFQGFLLFPRAQGTGYTCCLLRGQASTELGIWVGAAWRTMTALLFRPGHFPLFS